MTLRKWILLSALLGMLAGCGGPYNSGDRVLVFKSSYDNPMTPPKRYDVVVFKFPSTPVEKNTPKNYIKRLLGLPGEILAIFFGRLYRWAPEGNEPPPFDDLNLIDEKGNKFFVDPNKVWGRDFLHSNDERTRKWFEDGKFTMLRKPPHVMMALRRIVYDNDYQPKDLIGKLDRWEPNGTWSKDNATGFRNSGEKLDDVAWLRYEHLVCPEEWRDDPKKKADITRANVKKMLINDALDYNTFQEVATSTAEFYKSFYNAAHWVGDLMIECNVEVAEAKGEFWFELSKGVDRFRARFNLATGDCTLFREGSDGKQQELETKPTRAKGPGNYLLRFANIDARLTVWVDRDFPFGDGKEYDPPEVRTKNEKISDEDLLERRGPRQNDFEPASIGSKGASVTVKHLKVWRDIYYRTSHDGTDYKGAMRREDWCEDSQSRLSDLRKLESRTMYVQPGHYLCLGDNSQQSSDSRDWGLVPQRLMLGRALAIYYPLDRIGPIR